jgi:hypothetical protein
MVELVIQTIVGADSRRSSYSISYAQGDSIEAWCRVGVSDCAGVIDGQRWRAIAKVPGGGHQAASGQVGEGDHCAGRPD